MSGCAVTVSSGMTVNVAAGQVAVPTQNNSGTTLCTSDATEQVTLAAAPGSGTNRYDLVVCQPRGQDLDGGANNDFIFTNVTGTAAATPAVPAVPPGAVALAQIYVPGGSASVTAGNITDRRGGTLAVGSAVYARYFRTAALTINTAVGLVPLDTRSFDSHNAYNTTTGLYTVPVAGIYRVGFAIACGPTAGANQSTTPQIYRNGARYSYTSSAAAEAASRTVSQFTSDLVSCAVGDTLAMWASTFGANLPLTGLGAGGSVFGTFEYVGPTVT